ncbi:MAG TPA: tetratricopeptide repeat protein [Chloroflexota bacterium]
MANLEEVRARAYSALAAGDPGTALSLATVIQRHFPDDYQTMELMGKIYVESHQLKEATEAFQALLEVDPESVVAWSALGMLAEDAGDPSAAIEYFDRAFDINPGNREIAAEIKRIKPSAGRAKSEEPGSSMHSMGRHYLLEKKYESSLPWLQEAARIAPESVEIAVALARALWLAWRPAEAGETAREVLSRHPRCLRALVVAAGTARSRESAAVTAMLDRAAALNPGNVVARGLFQEAGIDFPERFDPQEIPDEEVEGALSSAGVPEAASQDSSEGPEALPEQAAGKVEEEVPTGALNTPELAADVSPDDEASNPLLRRLRALRESTGGTVEAPEAGIEPARAEPPEPPSGPPQLIFEPSEKGRMLAAAATPPPAEVVPEPPADQQARQRIAAAASFADQGMLDMALSTYREALKVDPSFAPEIVEALEALADANPQNAAARWLAGDAMAADGKYRRAVEQYLQVLKADGGATTQSRPAQ